MTATQILKTATAPATLCIGVASVIGGAAAATAHGNFEILPFLACLIFCVFAQMFSNLMHRYYDDKHQHGENMADGMYYCEDLDRPVSFVLKEGIKVTGMIAATAGLAIIAFANYWALAIGALIILLAVITNIGKHPLSRSVLFPVITFIAFGPIAVIGTCIVQSQASAQNGVSWWDVEPAIIMSIVIGLMAVNCHLIYGTFHRRENLKSSRTTFIGRYAKNAYVTLMGIFTVVYGVAGVLIPVFADLQWHSLWYMPVPVLSAIFSLYTIHLSRKKGNAHKAWHYSLLNIVLFAVLSFIIISIIGYPEGSLDNAPGII